MIRTERWQAGAIEITLDAPRSVRLWDADVTATYQWEPTSCIVLVRSRWEPEAWEPAACE